MNAQEGIRRLIRIISVIAWLALAISAVTGALSAGSVGEALVFIGIGGIIFVVLQGIAWVLVGFSGNLAGADGLVRPRDFRIWRKTKGKPDVASARSSGPAGVNGWLLLLVIGMLVLGPLRNVAETMNAIHDTEAFYPALLKVPLWNTYKLVIWSTIAAACAASIAGGWRLRNDHRPQTVRFAIWMLWLSGPIGAICILFEQATILGAKAEELFSAQAVGGQIGVLAYAAVWTIYLKVSRRVRNTYVNPHFSVPHTDRQEPVL
jgi:hypothetical protein